MAATATTSLLTCAHFSRQGQIVINEATLSGFRCSTRSLVQKKKERQCMRRSGLGLGVITAKIELKQPPYMLDDLEPHMSKETLEYHWGRHHRGYVDNLNKQIVGTELDGLTLEGVVLVSYNKGDVLPAFNNAAQIWNHEFFWESMKPGGGGKPSGDLLKLIDRDFGSFEAFVKEFKLAASTQFGSGWAWLAYKANRLDVGNAVNPRPSEEDKKLVVVKSPNAVNPLVWDYYPLLTIDVWEHSYYIDFQNQKADYISTFIENLVSWETVSSRLEIAKSASFERDREAERKRKEEEEAGLPGSEVTEMYLENESEDSEAE